MLRNYWLDKAKERAEKRRQGSGIPTNADIVEWTFFTPRKGIITRYGKNKLRKVLGKK
jgi:hypothetical protein